MVKKKEDHKNNWLIILVAIVALLALILAAIAVTKANMSGNAIRDWFKRETVIVETPEINDFGKGMLGNAYLTLDGKAEDLGDYEARFDKDGNLMYEIIDGKNINLGDGYQSLLTSSNTVQILAPSGGSPVWKGICGCEYTVGGGGCSGSCSTAAGNKSCEGTCSGDGCTSTTCKFITWYSPD